MGSWGTAISSNDTYADIYAEFFDLYNDGLDVKKVTAKLISKHQETINHSTDCHNFWFALAKAQWECKQLDQNILERVRYIIKSGADLEVWRKLDAQEKDVKKRQVVLDKFLEKLLTEQPKAKARKRKIIRQPPFNKGDCLTFKLANGKYGGAVVLEAVSDTEYGCCLIATTRLNQTEKPVKSDFENAEVLFIDGEKWSRNLDIKWYLPIRHKQIEHLLEKVATLEVEVPYSLKNDSHYGFVGDFDTWVIQVADQQLQAEKSKSEPTERKTIRELTKRKNKWSFWQR